MHAVCVCVRYALVVYLIILTRTMFSVPGGYFEWKGKKKETSSNDVSYVKVNGMGGTMENTIRAKTMHTLADRVQSRVLAHDAALNYEKLVLPS